MVTLEQYFDGRDVEFPPSEAQVENANDLLEKVSLLEEALGADFICTSGYRPEALIEDGKLPGIRGDAHSQCMGIDIHDPGLGVSRQLVDDPTYLVTAGLWMESPISAKNHLHLQSMPPKSGKRIFIA